MVTTTAESQNTLSQLIARAKDILAERRPPSPIGNQPGFDNVQDLPRAEPCDVAGDQLSVSGYVNPRVWWNLQTAYGGMPTACLRLPGGGLSVLASGIHEVGALVAALSADERKRITIEYPDPPMTLVRVEDPEGKAAGPETLSRLTEVNGVGRDQ